MYVYIYMYKCIIIHLKILRAVSRTRKYPDQPVLDDPPCDFNVGKLLGAVLGAIPRRGVIKRGQWKLTSFMGVSIGKSPVRIFLIYK